VGLNGLVGGERLGWGRTAQLGEVGSVRGGPLGWGRSAQLGLVVYPNRGITSTITVKGGLGFTLASLGD
jgi:hypothetical protein